MTAKLKAVPRASKEDQWKSRLAEATGNWAFVLSMSRRMVFTLQCVRDGHSAGELRGKPSPLGPHSNHWVPAVDSLIKRGLVLHESRYVKTPDGQLRWDVNHYPYHLTPAGECVVKLLEYAGLMKDKST